MQISELTIGTTVQYTVEGRIDVNGSQMLEKELATRMSSAVAWNVILDFSKVEYISSAGIRVLLSTHKKMKENHKMIIRNPSQFCRQVFEVTGADIFLNIE
jgi:anti-sigma B factor antagonist